MIESDEKTPTRPTLTPIEQLLNDVGEMRVEQEKALKEQREARLVLDGIASNQLRFDATQKEHDKRLVSLERERRLPQIALFLVAIVAIAAIYIRATHGP